MQDDTQFGSSRDDEDFQSQPNWEVHLPILTTQVNIDTVQRACQDALNLISQDPETFGTPVITKIHYPRANAPELETLDPAELYSATYAESLRLQLSTPTLMAEQGLEHLKRSLLAVLRQLFSYQAILGQTSHPLPNKAIAMPAGLPTVFSYAPSELGADRDAPLQPFHLVGTTDPLRGLQISEQDLTDRQIELEQIRKIRGIRKLTLSNRVAAQTERATEIFEQISEQSTERDHSQEGRISQAKLALQKNKSDKAAIQQLRVNMPLDSENGYRPYFENDRAFLAPNLDASTRIANLKKIDAAFSTEMNFVVKHFEENRFARAFFEDHFSLARPDFKPKSIRPYFYQYAKCNLTQMQTLYLVLAHIGHQQAELDRIACQEAREALEANLAKLNPEEPRYRSLEQMLKETDNLPEDRRDYRLQARLFRNFNDILNSDEALDADDIKARLQPDVNACAGKGSTWLKVLAGVLIAAGVLLGVSSGLALAAAFHVAHVPGLLNVGLPLSTELGIAGGGLALIGAGIGIAYIARDYGLRRSAFKAMDDIAGYVPLAVSAK